MLLLNCPFSSLSKNLLHFRQIITQKAKLQLADISQVPDLLPLSRDNRQIDIGGVLAVAFYRDSRGFTAGNRCKHVFISAGNGLIRSIYEKKSIQ